MNAVAYTDISVICRNCQCAFTFTVAEQEFFASKGLVNQPKRCHDCRIEHKAAIEKRQLSEVLCANCGAKTRVPFKPSGSRPVYCCVCMHNVHTCKAS